jgi:phosphoribosylformylglycinamidine synthase subunit PurS
MKTYAVQAEIMPKGGVNDPQGESVLSGLRLLGFENTSRVRVGKLIRFQLDAESVEDAHAAATQMCDKLLANPVIEEYELSISERNGH